MMKKHLLLLPLLLAGTPLLAQPLQTLYYPNGAKLLEGRFTFTKSRLLPQMAGFESKGGSQRPTPPNQRVAGLPGNPAEAISFMAPGALGMNPAELLHLTPADGPLTYWPTYGEASIVIHYTGGVPQGTLTEYYGPGQILQTGNVVNGMPDGPWTYRYKSGKLFYSGTYKAYSQAQMEGIWAHDYSLIAGGEEVAQNIYRNGGLTRALKLEPASQGFIPFYRVLLGGTQKEGPFNFFNPEGGVACQMEFEANLPAGTWKLWGKTRGELMLTIEWKAGEVAFMTDEKGTRRNPAALEKKQAEPKDPNQVSILVHNKYTGVSEPRLVTPNSGVGVIESSSVNPPMATPGVYTYVEQMPAFEGSVNDWLTKNMRYPESVRKAGIEGRVVVKFVVRENGSVTDAKVEKGVSPELDAEALRLVRVMPNWKPGKQNGKAVSVYFRLPVKFSLN